MFASLLTASVAVGAPTRAFDHFKTGFPLTGQHQTVACESCHANGVFEGTPSSCQTCHNSVRASGKPSIHVPTTDNCDRCHTSKAWSIDHFDHGLTTAACSACHNGTQAVGKPASHPVTSARCEQCHTTASFSAARFDHGNVSGSCASCHDGTRATGKPSNHIPTTAGCETCHTTNSWQNARFDHNGVTGNCVSCHNGTRAPGKPTSHLTTTSSCESCHGTTSWTTSRFDHTQATGTCASCHNGSKAPGKPSNHITTSAGCETCHTTSSWSGATFNHSAVTGACASCHNGTNAPGKPSSHLTTTNSCESCHGTTSWTTSRFDHTQATGIRLLQRQGGGRIVELGGPEIAEIRLATQICDELVDAIKQGELHVCFQPKARADTGATISAEVLVRWISASHGDLSPSTFIPIVESAGLLPHVTDWVLRQAAMAQVALRERKLASTLAVNIGATEFNSSLPERILDICSEYDADPSQIEIEITETSLMANPKAASEVSQTLHASGIVVALDDFGTGFSSLSHLRQCDVDAIKIDRSFIERIAESETDRKIIHGIIMLAHSLGLRTIAEGVETEAQHRWLQDNGCDVVQGYLISRPLRFADYLTFLEARTA